MTNFRLLLGSALLILLAACTNLDQGLLNKMQAEMGTVTANTDKVQAVGKTILEVRTQIEGAAEGIKSNPAYPALLEKINGYAAKNAATSAEFADLTTKMNTLTADYNAGKIKTDAATKELEVLSTGFKGITEIADRLTVLTATTKSEFEQLAPVVVAPPTLTK